MTTWYDVLPSELGELTLTATDAGLSGVFLPGHRHGPPSRDGWAHGPARLRAARDQLTEYLAGGRTGFDLELAPSAGTPFQRRVWEALDGIGYGETVSYAQLAQRVGTPAAVRAVGAANGRNPLSIVRPCHRVIGADGSLTGYGGGVAAKRWLLALETGAVALPF